MKIVKKADKRSETIVVPGSDIVTVHHMTIHDTLPDDSGFQHETRFDFDGVTEDQLKLLASRSALIDSRVVYNFKSADPMLIPTTIKVKDLLARSKPVVAAVDKAKLTLAKKLGVSLADLDAVLTNLK